NLLLSGSRCAPKPRESCGMSLAFLSGQACAVVVGAALFIGEGGKRWSQRQRAAGGRAVLFCKRQEWACSLPLASPPLQRIDHTPGRPASAHGLCRPGIPRILWTHT